MAYIYKQLIPTDVSKFRDLMKLFGEEFGQVDIYQRAKPSGSYIKNFLIDKEHIVLVAQEDTIVVGGVVAYILKKFEQERCEIYIYDLAVFKKYQRKGIGTKLIKTLKDIARTAGISTIFVQTDKVDKGATAFYKSLDAKLTDAYTFEIEV